MATVRIRLADLREFIESELDEEDIKSDLTVSDDEGTLIPEASKLSQNKFMKGSPGSYQIFMQDWLMMRKPKKHFGKDYTRWVDRANEINWSQYDNAFNKWISSGEKIEDLPNRGKFLTSSKDSKQNQEIDVKSDRENAISILQDVVHKIFVKCDNDPETVLLLLNEITVSSLMPESLARVLNVICGIARFDSADRLGLKKLINNASETGLLTALGQFFKSYDTLEYITYNFEKDKNPFATVAKNLSDKLMRCVKTKLPMLLKKLDKFEDIASDGPLGKYAFATNRAKTGLDSPPAEQNTPFEDMLYDTLSKHFDHRGKIPVAAARTIKTFIDNEQYSDVFNEPDQDIVYRCMGVDEKWMERILGHIPKKSGKIKKKFTFNPKGGASSSWSISQKSAKKFGAGNAYQIMLVASIKNNPSAFASGPGGLYNVKGPNGYDKEKEAVGLGPIIIDGFSWETARERNG
jgi:hypothetical protein